MDTKVARYRDHLSRLTYPEYAIFPADTIADDGSQPSLDLSMWNDILPPGVMEVAVHALPRVVGAYSFAQDKALIDTLAARLGVRSSEVLITAGADGALRIAAQYCMRAGTRVLIPEPCFGRYIYHAMAHQAKIFHLRFDSYPYELDVAKISDEVRRKKIDCVFIASPNNPTGHALSRESIKLLLDNLSCPVVLDESLLLATHSRNRSSLLDTYPNLIICGSFSKLYGLPGLRVGYLLTNRSQIQPLSKLVSPFEVDGLALEIAKHALTQDKWLSERASLVRSGIAALRSVDGGCLRVTRTSAPVALIEYTGSGGNLKDMLRSRGVLTVGSKEFSGLDNANAVRVIIKSVKDMLQLKQILATIA